MKKKPGPLSGLRVVEMAGLGPGPFSAMLLGDLGADVIRIDRKMPAGATSPYPNLGTRFDVLARGRRSIVLDLKAPGAIDVVLALIEQSDALVEGYRPGVMERLGLGPDACFARNPKLVYGRMTGWGQEGPLANRAGHDIDYIALSGALHAIGRADTPPAPPLNLVGDFGGGGMLLAFGIVCALLEARTSGKGQVVDAAMTDGAALLMAMAYGDHAAGTMTDARASNMLDGGAPFYDTYVCADGKYIAVGAIEPQFYAQLLALTGADSGGDAASAVTSQHDRSQWPTQKRRLAALFATRTRDQWMLVFEGSDACVAPVLDLAEAPAHPHNVARKTFVRVDGVTQPATAPRFLRTPGGPPASVAAPGSDTEEVLRGIGLDADALRRLRAAGAI